MLNPKESTHEKIDLYLSGGMDDKERGEFEHTMSEDAELQKKVLLCKDIIFEIRRKNAKKLLRERNGVYNKKRRMRRVFLLPSSIAAVAACLIFSFIQINTINHYKQQGSDFYSEYQSLTRGYTDADSLISVAYNQIGNNEYDVAIKNLDKAMVLIDAEKYDVNTEEGEYYNQLIATKRDEIMWLKAIVYMKNGKVYKAKRILKDISKSKSIYKDKALQALDR